MLNAENHIMLLLNFCNHRPNNGNNMCPKNERLFVIDSLLACLLTPKSNFLVQFRFLRVARDRTMLRNGFSHRGFRNFWRRRSGG